MCRYIYRCEVLLITGLRSRYVADTDVIHKEMAPGMSSMIKVMVSQNFAFFKKAEMKTQVDDVAEPLVESPEKVLGMFNHYH